MRNDNKNSIALVVDDHPLFRDSFSLLLERMDLFSEVRTVATSKELIQILVSNPYTKYTVFLDFYLGERTSLSLISQIKQLNRHAKIIVVSSITSPVMALSIMMQKPNGFISKSSDVGIIIQCLHMIQRDKLYVCPVIAQFLDEAEEIGHTHFTDRELEILSYFAEGLSVIETAEAIYLSKHTVVSHRRNMMAKSGTNSITELLAYAHRMGLIQ